MAITSFRPLLGFFIFQSIPDHMYDRFKDGFRPLLGFFIFQSKRSTNFMVWMKQFPSPIGVLYISMKEKMITRTIVTTVSVPYWGSLYFN